jgi:hypothetical protein
VGTQKDRRHAWMAYGVPSGPVADAGDGGEQQPVLSYFFRQEPIDMKTAVIPPIRPSSLSPSSESLWVAVFKLLVRLSAQMKNQSTVPSADSQHCREVENYSCCIFQCIFRSSPDPTHGRTSYSHFPAKYACASTG